MNLTDIQYNLINVNYRPVHDLRGKKGTLKMKLDIIPEARLKELYAIDFTELLRGNDGTFNWIIETWEYNPTEDYVKALIVDTLWSIADDDGNELYSKQELRYMYDAWATQRPHPLFAEILGVDNPNDVCYICGYDNGPNGEARNGFDCGWCGGN